MSVVVATAEMASGPWSYLPVKLSADRRSVSFTAKHFSIFTVIGQFFGATFDEFKTLFLDGLDSGATMTVNKPSCKGEAQARSGGYSITSSATDAVYWCFGMSGSNRILKVVDDRRYPMEISHPNLSVSQAGSIDWAQLSSLSHFGSGQDTILAPGDQVTYQVNVPPAAQGGIQTQMDGLGQSLYALDTGVNTMIEILTKLGAGGASSTADSVGKFLGIPSCADSMNKGPGALVSGCFSPSDLLKALGTAGLLLAPIVAVGGLVAFFHSEWNALVDQFSGHDKYTVAITHGSQVAPCSASVFTPLMTDSTAAGGTSNVSRLACGDGWAVVSGSTSFGPGGSPPEFFVGVLQWKNDAWVVSYIGDGSCLAATSANPCAFPPPTIDIPHTLLVQLTNTAGLEVDSTGTVGPLQTGPSGPGYDAARQEWLTSPSVGGSYQQNVPFIRAISDLQSGLQTDRSTSGYTQAIGELQQLSQLPDAMVTPEQDAEATADETALDTFFDTPSLY